MRFRPRYCERLLVCPIPRELDRPDCYPPQGDRLAYTTRGVPAFRNSNHIRAALSRNGESGPISPKPLVFSAMLQIWHVYGSQSGPVPNCDARTGLLASMATTGSRRLASMLPFCNVHSDQFVFNPQALPKWRETKGLAACDGRCSKIAQCDRDRWQRAQTFSSRFGWTFRRSLTSCPCCRAAMPNFRTITASSPTAMTRRCGSELCVP